MSDDGGLRWRIRALVLAGRLPQRPVHRLWGGAGTGLDCAACGRPVRPEEVELEIACEDDVPATERTRFHARCFNVWESEVRSVGATLSGPGDLGTIRGDERRAAEGAE
jgi:hypothetical protein